MSREVSDRLYNLLPSIYRILDAEKGYPLKTFLRIVEREMVALEEDIDGLYDDWFIETCAPWAIPYIGDLLGIRNLHTISNERYNLRSYVANTTAYRRRKGTATVIEQISQDITGWPAHAVEFFKKIATTQRLDHQRLNNLQSPNLRNAAELELLGDSFEGITRTIDIRLDNYCRHGYNISGVGIFLWRLQSYPLIRVDARKKIGKGYCFDPTGKDIPLFNRPKTQKNLGYLSDEIDLPRPIRRQSLQDEIERIRLAAIQGEPAPRNYFRPPSILNISIVYDNGSIEEIRPEQMIICDIPNWGLKVPPEIRYKDYSGQEHIYKIRAAVDPERGRLILAESKAVDPSSIADKGISGTSTSEKVVVSYSYGFNGDVGAGPYDRSAFILHSIDREVDWQAGVSQEEEGEKIFKTIGEAVRDWNKQPKGTNGIIAVMDNKTYNESINIEVPEGSFLIVVAADWLVSKNSEEGGRVRQNGNIAARMRRPHILGNISVKGTAGLQSLEPGEVLFDGLLVEGKLTIEGGNLGGIKVAHCTFLPGMCSIEIKSEAKNNNDNLSLEIMQAICGGITLPQSVPYLNVIESIIDHPNTDSAVDAYGSEVCFERSTILGKIKVLSLEASNSLFTDIVEVAQRQKGWVRYCYLPLRSRTPHRYCCQPNMALTDRAKQLGFSSSDCLSEWESKTVENRLRPAFTSVHYGEPGYAELAQVCAKEISMGSEDSSEMGVFSSLQRPQREANLRMALEEYLPSTLEAGIFFMT